MSKDLNKVVIIGRLGQDPEMRYTAQGQAVVNISIATNNRWKDANDREVNDTQWHRLVAWGKAAEVLNQYVKKGQRLYVEGRLQYRKWQDKEGVDRFSTDIVVGDFIFLEHSDRGVVAGSNGRAVPAGVADEPPF